MIFDYLANHQIPYQRVDHPPVFTCEEADRLVPTLPGAKTKNLFLRDGKGKRHFLLAVRPEKRVSLKELGKVLGISGLGLASPERLKQHLQLEPGSVTLLGLVNDSAHGVELLIDRDLWCADAFLCHPLTNTSTLVISKTDLSRFFSLTGHSAQVVDVPVVSSDS